MNNGPIRLRRWRQGPRAGGGRTLAAAARLVGVAHSTWSEWESGGRHPRLQHALALELVTGGAVPLEAWGFPAALVDTLRAVVAHRDRRAAAARTGTDG
jgi:hypothetical protein